MVYRRVPVPVAKPVPQLPKSKAKLVQSAIPVFRCATPPIDLTARRHCATQFALGFKRDMRIQSVIEAIGGIHGDLQRIAEDP